MRALFTLLFIITVTFAYASNGCKVVLVLNTKVYVDADFRSEPLTYLKRGMEVEVVGYERGFYQIKVDNQSAFITEASIKENEAFSSFRESVFLKMSNPQKETSTNKAVVNNESEQQILLLSN